jgi:WD40 repeat protein
VGFGSEVEDVKMVEGGLAAIVGDNGRLSFWDLRTNAIVQTVQASRSDKKEIYAVAVNPVQRQLLLTGGEDESIRIWDRRNLSAHLHHF